MQNKKKTANYEKMEIKTLNDGRVSFANKKSGNYIFSYARLLMF